ncbi:hypothetical protein O6R08_00380 [Cutibacterium equinum]|uniref:Uncharacterized protein n=1 Tax=Cutibacterium equinum TaxID=3016342 RepID=A0ABY7QYE7_9ACTN|nr:hypothetical protein [Cutibacterium equinum]WCC80063.1 hypothetical protein O6R08_00380 [Cutibacterium equinum]
MDDVTALQRLIANRQRDLNAPSLIAMYRAANLPKGAITYETLRRMATGRQRSIRGDQTYEDLSTILRVSVDDVKSAEAGYTPIGGWERYERLNAEERKAVEGVMDAILAAREAGGSSDDRRSEAQKSPLLGDVASLDMMGLAADEAPGPTDRERMEAQWGDDPA